MLYYDHHDLTGEQVPRRAVADQHLVLHPLQFVIHVGYHHYSHHHDLTDRGVGANKIAIYHLRPAFDTAASLDDLIAKQVPTGAVAI